MKIKYILLFILTTHFTFAQKVIQLYEGKPKGSENWDWSEQTSTKNMFNTEVVYNVSQPTITAFLPPKEAANGTAVVIAPGGGFHTLSINSEGIDLAKWLNSKGVAAFVLKYRLVHSVTDDPVKELVDIIGNRRVLDSVNRPIIPLTMADGLTAVKYVRGHAKEMNIDPIKIGFIGFSAGATVAMSVVYNATEDNRPNFVAPIYGSTTAVIGSTPPSVKTPIFVAVASDDRLGLMPHSIETYKKWFDAKQPAELHIFEKGGHGFGMRKQDLPTDKWYERFGEWLKMQGFMTPPPAPTSPFQRIPSPNDTLQSVQHLSDGRLKFSIYAPDAQKVTVLGDFLTVFAPLNLDKDYNGVWSATTKDAVKPNIYTYDFTIDGIKTLDPKNTHFKESNTGFSNLFDIKSPENDFQSLKNVPHGKVEKLLYTSTALGGITRRLHVYLPPDYDKISKKGKLPVFYLLHGGGDNDASWTSVGKANLILDNLYAEGKLKPMIVVMPAGHTPIAGLAMGAGPEQDPFCRDFFTDIIPFIEKNYPVSTKREHRAVAGLSMGGIQTLNLALWQPEKFGYVYPMSTGYFAPTIKELEEKHSAIFKNKAVNQFKLFTIGMGKDDGLAYQNNKNMMAFFEKQGVEFTYRETGGGHTFLVWRENLAYITPLLFR